MSSIDSYFLDRGSEECEAFSSLHHKLSQTVDRHALSFLPQVSFAMLKPDAYLRGLMPNIVDELLAKGIYPVRHDLMMLGEDTIDDLYVFVKKKYSDTWWVMQKAYTLAPCLPMIVIGSPGRYEHLSARMRDLIGPTTPSAGRATQIRYAFRATHRVFNLVHGTDDPAAAARESLVFFDVDDLTKALKSAIELSERGSPPDIELESISQLVPDSRVDLRYSRIRLRVKQTALEILVQHLSPEADGRINALSQFVDQLRHNLSEEERIVSAELPLREERDSLSPVLSRQRTILVVMRGCVTDAITEVARWDVFNSQTAGTLATLHRILSTIDFINTLADPIRFRNRAFSHLLAEACGLGLHLEHIEEVVLHTGWAVAPQEFRDSVLTSPDGVR